MVKKRIMLVEDESVTAMDLKSNLIQLGYEVPAIVPSGEEAVRIAAEVRPDLVLMDITLAGLMNGIQAADELRKTLAIPIVFLTAHADAATIGRAKTTEPFGYLTKPSSIDTLMSTIEVALYKGEADALRGKAEQALQKSEEKYRTVADFTHDWEFWIGPDESFIYSSPSCEKVTGHSAAAFEQDPSLLKRIVHPDDVTLYSDHRHGAKTGNADGDIEFRILHADGETRWIAHVCQPVHDAQGKFIGTRGSNRDITARKSAELEREQVILEWQEALAKVKTLSGMLPVCASCKKIRDDQGYWQQIEAYISDHSEAEFSHGICPECAEKIYGEYYKKKS